MIEVKGVVKSFSVHRKSPGLLASVRSLFWRCKDQVYALRGLDLNIGDGEIVGLLGANGAGKTTLIKILSGIIHPSAGSVRVLGFDPWARKNDFRRQIALIMGQKAQLWWDLPAADCFLLLREIYQIPREEFQRRLNRLTEVLEVSTQLRTQIRRLSLGERMKMELIAALLHNPKVVFLDEPTIGLDLASQRALREFILEYHREHRPTMIVTSHYMEDIESLCKRIVIIREGQKVYDGDLDALRKEYATHKFITATLSASGEALNMTAKRLSAIDPRLSDDWGDVLEGNESAIKLKVLRPHISKVSSVVLERLAVDDLIIGEVDVGTIVNKIQKHGDQASS